MEIKREIGSHTYSGGTTKKERVYTDIHSPLVYQWEFIGPWDEEEKKVVEEVLIRNAVGSNYWSLYRGTWGTTYPFVARRYTWEYGVLHGNTAAELAQELEEYYS